MIEISDEDFSALIAEVMGELPREHMDAVKNVAIVYADEPTEEQREKLRLRDDESLFGLYEGVPLARRQGRTNLPPDKITIFKNPVLAYVNTHQELRAQVKHTVWHEIAHYFGLDHPAIHALENGHKPA
ncbi:MAG TPA: metallopeptidase family protein [Candidatus Saccharimonadales bacterium]|nr:metallopeptidase family protein [Candidatus Saccharimonadales bacterium]